MNLRNPSRITGFLCAVLVLFSLVLSAESANAQTKAKEGKNYSGKSSNASSEGVMRDDKAPKHKKTAKNADDADRKMVYLMSRALLKKGKEAEAAAVLSKLIDEYPKFVPPYSDLAGLQIRHGKLDEAQKLLAQGLHYAPNDPVLLNNQGVYFLAVKDYQQALESFEQALKADPASDRYKSNKALALGMLGRYDESLAEYDGILPHDAAKKNIDLIKTIR